MFFFVWNPKQSQLPNCHEIRWWAEPTKRRLGQVTSVVLSFLFWISWPLKMVPIGSPKMLVRNYLSMLHNISHDDLAMQALVWFCMVWFRVSWFGTIQIEAVQFDASYANLTWPHVFKCQILGKNLVLHSSQYGIYELQAEFRWGNYVCSSAPYQSSSCMILTRLWVYW